MKVREGFCVAMIAMGIASRGLAQVAVDPKLPDYKPVQGVSGSIKSVGSETMNNLLALWGEGFRSFYPNIRPEIEGKGSNTAPPALIEGTATFGPMSRPMKETEIDDFEKKYHYKPTGLPTSIDALAVFVNKDNPIKSLTMPQIDAIFSKTRKLGLAGDITRWGELGAKGDWEKAPISLYGRNSASGTYGFFKEHALGKGDYKDTVKELSGSSSVAQAIGREKFAIGYSGIGAKTADVHALSVAPDSKSPPVEATMENAYSGEYPLARALLIYVNVKPGETIDPLRAEFIKYILSKQGQELVIKEGYFPVTAKMAEKALKSVGLAK